MPLRDDIFVTSGHMVMPARKVAHLIAAESPQR
jgi:hypothetical protein